jgi:predicted RNase H-like nuclease (RuvC/YqgF family)
LIKDYEYRLKKKDDEINDLKRRIEEMSAEFAKMLKDTLDKMQDRIELAQWDNDSDPQIMKRLKDIAGFQNG